MPFTVNVGPYRGGEMIQQGLTNLGQGIAGGITGAVQEYKKTQEEQANDQILLNFYQNQGMVTPDIMNDYTKGSHSAKTGVIAGLTRQYAAQQQQAQEKRLQDEATSMANYRKAQIDDMIATRNYLPQAVQVKLPPPGQTGIPYGPPTEAEAAAPTVTMIGQSPGHFKEPEAPEGGFTTQPVEIRNPTDGQVEGFWQPTGKNQGQFINTRTTPVLDPNGNPTGYYTHGRSVIKPTVGKEWTPIQVEHAFKNFNVNASDIANSKAHHALDIHGEETSNPNEIVSYAIDTDHGRQYIPADSFEGLKGAVGGPDSLFNRHQQEIQKSRQNAKPAAAAIPAAASKTQEATDYLNKIGKPVTPANIKFYIDHT